jgi:histidyl-tRNA synthetase
MSGFADYSEAENVALSEWLDVIVSAFRQYGFSNLIPRPLELREVLLAQGGIAKQIFGVSRLQEDAPTDMALPFDRTVSLAHWVAMKAGEIVFPYKRYDIGYSYRGERAQAGRFQGFFQADIDIVGQDKLDIHADAECIAVIYDALCRLDIGSFRIDINHIRLAKTLLARIGVAGEKVADVLRVIDKLSKIGTKATQAELAEVLGGDDSAAESILALFQYTGKPEGFAEIVGNDQEALGFFEELKETWRSLVNLGIPEDILSFQPGIVRGLDYYSGVVFETFLTGYESFGSIASGGRYDDLVSTFSKLKLPGVGGSIGVTRLFDIACKKDLIKLERKSQADIFVGFRTPELKSTAQQIAARLRKAAHNVDLYSGTSAVKKQFSYAGRKNIPTLITVMDTEAIVIRNMQTGDQVEVTTIDQTCEEIEKQ